ncbi:zinc finger protein-like 1 homolog [Macrosteles quadrilineatus]|uniref:zinc finger protein-like 1 homolog n=1 Tax=Macrosteles quadrilineatus TaxID=74068 RepID=UPI0023E176EE|nr:zinc finger protein-like 1 homolog [Macrosteles quadrilineatus]
MGLCKCPKRRVTNQFCYEHRVNVCEYCIVTNHPKCVVQSYLRWLQDSDYSPTCVLCSKDLIIDDCVRLTCYHVFHWVCLDQFARRMPPTTAPAGFTCPSCKVCIVCTDVFHWVCLDQFARRMPLTQPLQGSHLQSIM